MVTYTVQVTILKNIYYIYNNYKVVIILLLVKDSSLKTSLHISSTFF